MVYNEARLLPVWLRHYASQVGAAHCYVVDHGSDDGSTDRLGDSSVIRLPRTAHDDTRRARFISDLCAGLLQWYDGVSYTDVDELVMPDPAHHADLRAFFAATVAPVSTAIGLNVVHRTGEAALDPTRSVLSQRSGAVFSSAMCKPVLIRRRVQWSPGFHCADAPLAFEGLYLFHLRYCDRAWALRRLAHTRGMARAPDGSGAHQRVSDAEFADLLDTFARLEPPADATLALGQPPVATWLARVIASQAGRENAVFTIDLGLNAEELWLIPPRFGRDPDGVAETGHDTHR